MQSKRNFQANFEFLNHARFDYAYGSAQQGEIPCEIFLSPPVKTFLEQISVRRIIKM
jgi:hypothetical protein